MISLTSLDTWVSASARQRAQQVDSRTFIGLDAFVLPDGGRWTSVLPFGAPWALTLTFKHVRGPYPGISLDDPDVDLTSMDQIQVHTVRDETPMQSNLAGFDIVLLYPGFQRRRIHFRGTFTDARNLSKLLPRTANLVNEWLEDWRAGNIQPELSTMPPELANKPASWVRRYVRVRGLRDLGNDTWGVILDILTPA